jgi:hypothetical protein
MHRLPCFPLPHFNRVFISRLLSIGISHICLVSPLSLSVCNSDRFNALQNRDANPNIECILA